MSSELSSALACKHPCRVPNNLGRGKQENHWPFHHLRCKPLKDEMMKRQLVSSDPDTERMFKKLKLYSVDIADEIGIASRTAFGFASNLDMTRSHFLRITSPGTPTQTTGKGFQSNPSGWSMFPPLSPGPAKSTRCSVIRSRTQDSLAKAIFH